MQKDTRQFFTAIFIVKAIAASLAFSLLFGFLGAFSTPAINADIYHRIIISLKWFTGAFGSALIFFAFMSIMYFIRIVYVSRTVNWGVKSETNIKQESLWRIGLRTFLYTLSPFLVLGILVLIIHLISA